MTFYHQISINKGVVFLTSAEIHKMLLQNQDIFITGLKRGKVFKRAETKKQQYENKFAQNESAFLDDLMQ